jgi:hypothetical protein
VIYIYMEAGRKWFAHRRGGVEEAAPVPRLHPAAQLKVAGKTTDAR